MKQKQSLFKTIKRYAKKRYILIPLSLVCSAISVLLSALPYVLLWYIIRELLQPNTLLPNSNLLIEYAWYAVGFALAGVVFYFLALLSSHIVAFRVERNIRSFSMKSILNYPLGFFTKSTSGQMRKVIDDNASITHGFIAHQLPDLCSAIFMPMVFIIFIFIFDWRFGLAALIPLILAFISISKMLGGDKKDSMRNYMDALESMNSEAVEYVRGVPVVKIFQQSIYSFKRFYKSILNYRDWSTNYAMACKQPIVLFSVSIQGITILLTIVCIILLNYIFYIIFTPLCAMMMNKILTLGENMNVAKEAFRRIDSLLYKNGKSLKQRRDTPFPTNHSIEFVNVSFKYEGAIHNAIQHVNFQIPHHSTTALVGPSSSGKTTIARLIPRFWNINEGTIKIGGVDINAISNEELMQNISFVFQSTQLFKISLFENIRYTRPKATREEVEGAVIAAQCQDIIDKFEKGLDTIIGSQGVYLSGREQQRIALARAILKDSPIIILDEATAFSDPENEHQIQQALKHLTKDKTVLMIAHRLPSIKDVDSIYVIKEASLVEQGTHEELIQQKGMYASMWQDYQMGVNWKLNNI